MGIDVFAPLMMQPQVWPPSRLDSRGVFGLTTMGHLKPGVTTRAATAEAAVVASQLDAEHPIPNYARRLEVVPIWKSPFGAQTYWLPAIGLFGGMGLLILLVACANVANLVLVRGVSRRGELGVRLAMGASRSRLLRLLFVENMVLALPGALIGVVLASFILPYIATGAAAAAPSRVYLDISVDGYVLTFAIALSCACAIVFGFMPALRASRVELTSALNELSPRMATRGRLRSMLVVSQVAVSLVLLVAAGLVLRSYSAAQHADGGFESAGVTSVAIDLQTAGYDGTRGPVAITRLLDAFRTEPSFERATLALNVPMSLVDNASRVTSIEGYSPRSDEDMLFLYNVVAPDYFGTLRIPLVAGRDFTRTDDAGGQAAVIVNETLARPLLADPGECRRQAPAQWNHRMAQRHRRGARSQVFTLVGRAAPVRLLPAPPDLCAQPHRSRTRGRRPQPRNPPCSRSVQALDPTIPITRSTTLTEQTRVALSVYELAAGALTMLAS
jgi:predicted permease